MSLLIAAFILGITYSPHCAGMCGPIALAFPLQNNKSFFKFIAIFLYSTGRILTYGLMGLIFGFFGQGIQLAGLQQYLSVFLGVMIILIAIFPQLYKGNNIISRSISGIGNKISFRFSKLMGLSNPLTYFIIGLLNGLLPCGLVYMALAGSLLTANPFEGFLYMLFFGLGTVPILALIIYFKTGVQVLFQKKLRKIIPVLTILIGILFVLRGLDLGIKYISPKDKALKIKIEEKNNVPECCR